MRRVRQDIGRREREKIEFRRADGTCVSLGLRIRGREGSCIGSILLL